MQKWKGPIKSTYIELPDDLHREMRALGLKTGRKAADVYVEAADCLLKRVRYQDSELSIPNDSVADSDSSVLELLSTYADDPRCAECIQAIARIWAAGDEEFMDSITRNCRAFARAGEAIKGLSVDTKPSGDHQGRMGTLLEREARLDEEVDNPPEADRATGTGGRRMPPMGKKPIRKSNHG